jgi:hypothetical protein
MEVSVMVLALVLVTDMHRPLLYTCSLKALAIQLS